MTLLLFGSGAAGFTAASALSAGFKAGTAPGALIGRFNQRQRQVGH